jgi:hypothetical protein
MLKFVCCKIQNMQDLKNNHVDLMSLASRSVSCLAATALRDVRGQTKTSNKNLGTRNY